MPAANPKLPKSYRFPSGRPIFNERFATDLRPDGTPISQKRGGVHWERSIYYYWWRFLRTSQRYRLLCEKAGVGGNAALRRVYADFGNVFAFDDTKSGFAAWWNESNDEMGTNRGAYLFGYPALDRVSVVKAAADFDDEHAILVAIPKGLRKREIRAQLDTILKKEMPRKRGERLKTADVRYRPLHERMHGLDTALAVYELRQRNPKMPLWEVAHLAEASRRVKLNKDEADRSKRTHTADKKAYLAQHGHRLFARAEKVIAGVERGVFPTT